MEARLSKLRGMRLHVVTTSRAAARAGMTPEDVGHIEREAREACESEWGVSVWLPTTATDGA